MEIALWRAEVSPVKERLVYHVAPDKSLNEWAVIEDGKKAPRAKGLSKEGAVRKARRMIKRRARPATVLIHKTRYIIERQFEFSA